MCGLYGLCRNQARWRNLRPKSGKAAKALKISDYGHLVRLPTAVTVWVVSYIVSASDQLVNLLPKQWRPQYVLGFNIPGLGVIVNIAVLFITGLFAANVISKQILPRGTACWGSSVVKSIYSSVKKYPKRCCPTAAVRLKHQYSCRFPNRVFGQSHSCPVRCRMRLKTALPKDGDYLSVYVPTTPNPISGYYIMVEKRCARTRHERGRSVEICDFAGYGHPDDLPVKTLAGPMPSEKADLPEQQ